jgi:thiamine biosynthesis protein ThiI
LPYEDCCTVFTPKHPKPNPAGTGGAPSALDLEALIEAAVQGAEIAGSEAPTR